MREFRKAFPLVSVTLTEDFPDDLIERMRNDKLDVGFIGTSVAHPGEIVVDLLQSEAMIVALSSGHPLARRASGGNRIEEFSDHRYAGSVIQLPSDQRRPPSSPSSI
jgi:DNA-binding transcriptional LysR family regulator